MPQAADLYAAKRAAMLDEFYGKFFLLGGWLGATDTYKRTMWSAVPEIALERAGYSTHDAQGLPEPGADNQLIMAGHETMLAQWFHRPLKRADIELAGRWFSGVCGRAQFPERSLGQVRCSTHRPAKILFCRSTFGAFRAGRRFLPGVPCLFFEGMGGVVSYLEPAMCRYFAPILRATKGRLMKLATPCDAEFGLRPPR